MSLPGELVVNSGSTAKTEGVEWDFEMCDGSSKVLCSGVYNDQYLGWLARAPFIRSAHPEYSGLFLKKIRAKRLAGLQVDVSLFYESNDPTVSYPGRPAGKVKRYTIEPTMSEEPILACPAFTILAHASKTSLQTFYNSSRSEDDYNTAVSGIGADPAALALLARIHAGQDSFRFSNITWVEKFSTKTLSDVEVNKILKTVASPPGIDPSLVRHDRDWLRLAPNVTPHDNGKEWNIENRWEESLPGKWDPVVYPAA